MLGTTTYPKNTDNMSYGLTMITRVGNWIDSNVLKNKGVGVALLLFLWNGLTGHCQTVNERSSLPLSFSAIHPQSADKKTLMQPSHFLMYGFLDAQRADSESYPSCFCGVDWISFRLTAPNLIDSIRIGGDYRPDCLLDFFESRCGPVSPTGIMNPPLLPPSMRRLKAVL